MHKVLGALMMVVVLWAGWVMLKPSASTPRATAGVAVGKPAVSPMTRFATSGAAVCAGLNTQVKALGAYPKGAKAQAVWLRKDLAYQAAAIKAIKALHPPAIAAAKLRTLYAQEAAMNKVGLLAVKDLRTGHPKAAAAQLAKVNARSTKVSAAYVSAGLPTCGS
jgi:hypothetical protein